VPDKKDSEELKLIVETMCVILNQRKRALTDEQILENIQASRARRRVQKIERMTKNRSKALPQYEAAIVGVDRTEENWLERPPTTQQEVMWRETSLGEVYGNARWAARHFIDNCDLVQTRDVLNSANMRLLEASNDMRVALYGTKAGEPNEKHAAKSRKYRLYQDIVKMAEARIKQYESGMEESYDGR
jgi:hypothetical protein